jgi:hypothetical protein
VWYWRLKVTFSSSSGSHASPTLDPRLTLELGSISSRG